MSNLMSYCHPRTWRYARQISNKLSPLRLIILLSRIIMKSSTTTKSNKLQSKKLLSYQRLKNNLQIIQRLVAVRVFAVRLRFVLLWQIVAMLLRTFSDACFVVVSDNFNNMRSLYSIPLKPALVSL